MPFGFAQGEKKEEGRRKPFGFAQGEKKEEGRMPFGFAQGEKKEGSISVLQKAFFIL